jgi:hypothetical protein
MKIQNLQFSDYRMFNPTKDEVIVDEECNDKAKSLIAYWLDDSMATPIIKDETLKKSWEANVERHKEDNDDSPYWEHLIKFLEGYDSSEWIGYEISSYGLVCSAVFFIVDKEVIVEEKVN